MPRPRMMREASIGCQVPVPACPTLARAVISMETKIDQRRPNALLMGSESQHPRTAQHR